MKTLSLFTTALFTLAMSVGTFAQAAEAIDAATGATGRAPAAAVRTETRGASVPVAATAATGSDAAADLGAAVPMDVPSATENVNAINAAANYEAGDTFLASNTGQLIAVALGLLILAGLFYWASVASKYRRENPDTIRPPERSSGTKIVS